MLSNEEIAKFQQLYRNRFGEEITREEAIDKGEKLIRLIRAVYQPLSASNTISKTEALR